MVSLFAFLSVCGGFFVNMDGYPASFYASCMLAAVDPSWIAIFLLLMSAVCLVQDFCVTGLFYCRCHY